MYIPKATKWSDYKVTGLVNGKEVKTYENTINTKKAINLFRSKHPAAVSVKAERVKKDKGTLGITKMKESLSKVADLGAAVDSLGKTLTAYNKARAAKKPKAKKTTWKKVGNKRVKVTKEDLSSFSEFTERQEAINEELDNLAKLVMLARNGLVATSDVAGLRLALKAMYDDRALAPHQRETLIGLLGRLIDLVLGDRNIFQRLRNTVHAEAYSTKFAANSVSDDLFFYVLPPPTLEDLMEKFAALSGEHPEIPLERAEDILNDQGLTLQLDEYEYDEESDDDDLVIFGTVDGLPVESHVLNVAWNEGGGKVTATFALHETTKRAVEEILESQYTDDEAVVDSFLNLGDDQIGTFFAGTWSGSGNRFEESVAGAPGPQTKSGYDLSVDQDEEEYENPGSPGRRRQKNKPRRDFSKKGRWKMAKKAMKEQWMEEDFLEAMDSLEEARERPTGQRVKINQAQGGMREFHGHTGIIVGREGNQYRVKLDAPVNIPGVGDVSDDLWDAKFIKTHYAKGVSESRKDVAAKHKHQDYAVHWTRGHDDAEGGNEPDKDYDKPGTDPFHKKAYMQGHARKTAMWRKQKVA